MTSNSGHTSHRKRRNYGPLIAGLASAAAVLALVVVLLITGSGNKTNNTPAGSSTLAPSTAPAVTATPSSLPSESPSASPSTTGVDPTDLSSTKPNPAPSIDSKICQKPNPPKFTALLTSDEPVEFSKGAIFQIAPCLSKNETIWIFNFDTEKSVYVLDTATSKSGVQTYTDKIAGNTVVNFFLGNKECSDWINGQDANADFGNRIVLNDKLVHYPGCKLLSYKTLTVATAQN